MSHRPRLRTVFLPLALSGTALLLAPTAGQAATRCAHASGLPGNITIGQARRATFCLLNRNRAAHGLSRLSRNLTLQRAATRYSVQMERGHFFSHTSPSGQTFVQRLSGYIRGAVHWLVGENLAWGTGHYSRPSAIVRDWMHSPEHRANILRRGYREIGIGIAYKAPYYWDSTYGATYTTEFGSRH